MNKTFVIRISVYKTNILINIGLTST